MRYALLLGAGLLLGACASAPRTSDPVAGAGTPAACASPALRDAPAGWCALPADVRTFVDDRDTCDHFRGEPWPESDSDADRARRKELLEGVRTNCAGIDARLAELKVRYATDARVVSLLSGFESSVER